MKHDSVDLVVCFINKLNYSLFDIQYHAKERKKMSFHFTFN